MQVPTIIHVRIHLRPIELKILPFGFHIRKDLEVVVSSCTTEVLLGENLFPLGIHLSGFLALLFFSTGHAKCLEFKKDFVFLGCSVAFGTTLFVMKLLIDGGKFLLAGFKPKVVKTTSASHARNLAYSADYSTCRDGSHFGSRICYTCCTEDNDSDKFLVWTVLGVRDPISALAIMKGGLTATDVFVVEWIQTGFIHFGMAVRTLVMNYDAY
ncbi:hypothetical protein Tco_1440469 [Tanacetum coccineum]